MYLYLNTNQYVYICLNIRLTMEKSKQCPILACGCAQKHTHKQCPICGSVVCWKYQKIASKAEHDRIHDWALYGYER